MTGNLYGRSQLWDLNLIQSHLGQWSSSNLTQLISQVQIFLSRHVLLMANPSDMCVIQYSSWHIVLDRYRNIWYDQS